MKQLNVIDNLKREISYNIPIEGTPSKIFDISIKSKMVILEATIDHIDIKKEDGYKVILIKLSDGTGSIDSFMIKLDAGSYDFVDYLVVGKLYRVRGRVSYLDESAFNQPVLLVNEIQLLEK